MTRLFRSMLLAASIAGCVAHPPPSLAAFTVADNYRPLRYSASAAQMAFSVTWPFESTADLRVYTSADSGVTWVLKTLSTHYTVTGAGTTNGGTVTFASNGCDGSGTCDSGTGVLILRNDGIDRTSDFTTLTPDGINLHMDRQTMQLQQVEDFAENRAIQLPKQDDYSGSGITPILPSIVGNGGNAIIARSDELGVEWSEHALSDYALADDVTDLTSITVTNADGVVVGVTPANPLVESGTLAFSLGDITPDSVVTAGSILAVGNVIGQTSVQSPVLSAIGNGWIRLYEALSNGTDYISIKAPADLANTTTDYVWPAADGTSGYQLTTDGAGNLSWDAADGGGGVSLPTDACGYLTNDGTGGLSWSFPVERIGPFFIPGKPAAGEIVYWGRLDDWIRYGASIDFEANFGGGSYSNARAGEGATSTATFIIATATSMTGSYTNVGTITFDSGGNGSPTAPGTVNFDLTADDDPFSWNYTKYVKITAPASQDATLANVSIYLGGTAACGGG